MQPSANPPSADQTIVINQHWRRIQWVWLFVAVGVAVALFIWFSRNAYLRDSRFNPAFWLPYLGVVGVPFLLMNRLARCVVIFSADKQAVYRQTLFGKQHILNFADISSIDIYASTLGGTYVALYTRDNPYVLDPPRVSPRYTSSADSIARLRAFEQTVLPRLHALIRPYQSDVPVKPVITCDGDLTFYVKTAGEYRLKQVYVHDQRKWRVAIVFLSFSLLFLFMRQPDNLNMGIGLGLGGLIVLFLLSEKRSFRSGALQTGFVKDLFQQAYPISQFSTFEVVHQRINLIYVGTSINMIFDLPGRKKTVLLSRLPKTDRIEVMLRETRYVMQQQRSLES